MDVPSERIFEGGVLKRLALIGKNFWFYMEKVVWPRNLALIYPDWGLTDPPQISDFLPLLFFIVLALGLGLFTLKKWLPKGISALIASILFMLFPVIGSYKIYQMRYTPVIDHWNYLALMGTMALFTLAVSQVF